MKINKPIVQLRIGVVGSLLAVAITVIGELISAESLDRFLEASVMMLALSIPLLGLDVYLLISELLNEKQVISIIRGLLRFIAFVLFFAAMTSLFFHFSSLTGMLFIVAVLICILLFMRFYRELLNK